MIILEENVIEKILHNINNINFKSDLRSFKKGDSVYFNLNNKKLSKKKTENSFYLTEYHLDFKKAKAESIKMCVKTAEYIYMISNDYKNINEDIIIFLSGLNNYPTDLLTVEESNLIYYSASKLRSINVLDIDKSFFRDDELKLNIIVSAINDRDNSNKLFYDILGDISTDYIIEHIHKYCLIMFIYHNSYFANNLKYDLSEKIAAIYSNDMNLTSIMQLLDNNNMNRNYLTKLNIKIKLNNLPPFKHKHMDIYKHINSITIDKDIRNNDDKLFELIYYFNKNNIIDKLFLEKDYINYLEYTYDEKTLRRKFANNFQDIKLRSLEKS